MYFFHQTPDENFYLHLFSNSLAQSKITLFIFCIIESEQETKDT